MNQNYLINQINQINQNYNNYQILFASSSVLSNSKITLIPKT